jgi:ATP-dependent helicase/nuclease subunit A
LAEAENEYRRLLYVAMTRAADLLIVCGADGERQRPPGCWYNLVREPLQPFLVAEGAGEDKVSRYRKPGDTAIRAAAMLGVPRTVHSEIPLWLRQPAPPQAPRLRSLSPSSAFDEEIGRVLARAAGSAAERRKALARGRIVHRLMQSLPDIPPPTRKHAITRYLKRAATDFSAAEQVEIARQVLTILEDPSFAEAFAAGSRAEVPIVGRIASAGGAPIAVFGQVDRLAVTGEAVLIADYKTDAAPPRALAEVPAAYIGQLALYRAVLERIYPEQTIRAALVFTAGPAVVEIPGPVMDEALAETVGQVTPG